jgi:hypothetical protein
MVALMDTREQLAHDLWLSKQVDTAFKKLNAGDCVLISHQNAKTQMKARKMKIRNKNSK